MFDWLLHLVRSLFTPPIGDDELSGTQTQEGEIEIPEPEPDVGGVMIPGG